MAEHDLDARLAKISTGPGVYLLKDAHGKVIYVGKAANLRTRVRRYVRGGDERSASALPGRPARRHARRSSRRTRRKRSSSRTTLIKQYRPRYNIRLKDDKSYVSVKVTVDDAWPRVLVTRRIVKDGSRYFGPFHHARRRARHARHDPQGVPAAHLQRRGLPQPEPAVHRVRHQALPRPVRPAGRPCRVRRAPAAGDAAPRGPEPRGDDVAPTAHGGRRRGRALRGGRRAARPDPGRRDDAGAPAGGRPLGRAIRTCSGSTARAARSRCRSSSCAAARSSRTIAYAFDDWELPDDEVLEAVLTQFYQATDARRARRDPPARADRRRGGARRVPDRAAREEGRRPRAAARATSSGSIEMARDNARQRFVRAARRGVGRARGRWPSCSGELGLPARPAASSASTSPPSRAASRSAPSVAFIERSAVEGRLSRATASRSVVGHGRLRVRRGGAGPAASGRASAASRFRTSSSSTAARAARGRAAPSSRELGLPTLPGDRSRQGARRARSDAHARSAASGAHLPAGTEEPGRPAPELDGALSCSSACATRRIASRTPTIAPARARPAALSARRPSPGVGPRRRRDALAPLRQPAPRAAGDRRGADDACRGISTDARRPHQGAR